MNLRNHHPNADHHRRLRVDGRFEPNSAHRARNDRPIRCLETSIDNIYITSRWKRRAPTGNAFGSGYHPNVGKPIVRVAQALADYIIATHRRTNKSVENIVF
ncbi:MAG: hypothetical protein MZU97_19950 [Bacillus subtilis]|nr:hypothetical protein [Bacillus subtilis]